MTELDRLAEVAEDTPCENGWPSAAALIPLVRAILMAMRDHPTPNLLDLLADGMGDTPMDHERAPYVWQGLMDEFLDEDTMINEPQP